MPGKKKDQVRENTTLSISSASNPGLDRERSPSITINSSAASSVAGLLPSPAARAVEALAARSLGSLQRGKQRAQETAISCNLVKKDTSSPLDMEQFKLQDLLFEDDYFGDWAEAKNSSHAVTVKYLGNIATPSRKNDAYFKTSIYVAGSPLPGGDALDFMRTLEVSGPVPLNVCFNAEAKRRFFLLSPASIIKPQVGEIECVKRIGSPKEGFSLYETASSRFVWVKHHLIRDFLAPILIDELFVDPHGRKRSILAWPEGQLAKVCAEFAEEIEYPLSEVELIEFALIIQSKWRDEGEEHGIYTYKGFSPFLIQNVVNPNVAEFMNKVNFGRELRDIMKRDRTPLEILVELLSIVKILGNDSVVIRLRSLVDSGVMTDELAMPLIDMIKAKYSEFSSVPRIYSEPIRPKDSKRVNEEFITLSHRGHVHNVKAKFTNPIELPRISYGFGFGYKGQSSILEGAMAHPLVRDHRVFSCEFEETFNSSCLSVTTRSARPDHGYNIQKDFWSERVKVLVRCYDLLLLGKDSPGDTAYSRAVNNQVIGEVIFGNIDGNKLIISVVPKKVLKIENLQGAFFDSVSIVADKTVSGIVNDPFSRTGPSFDLTAVMRSTSDLRECQIRNIYENAGLMSLSKDEALDPWTSLIQYYDQSEIKQFFWVCTQVRAHNPDFAQYKKDIHRFWYECIDQGREPKAEWRADMSNFQGMPPFFRDLASQSEFMYDDCPPQGKKVRRRLGKSRSGDGDNPGRNRRDKDKGAKT